MQMSCSPSAPVCLAAVAVVAFAVFWSFFVTSTAMFEMEATIMSALLGPDEA